MPGGRSLCCTADAALEDSANDDSASDDRASDGTPEPQAHRSPRSPQPASTLEAQHQVGPPRHSARRAPAHRSSRAAVVVHDSDDAGRLTTECTERAKGGRAPSERIGSSRTAPGEQQRRGSTPPSYQTNARQRLVGGRARDPNPRHQRRQRCRSRRPSHTPGAVRRRRAPSSGMAASQRATVPPCKAQTTAAASSPWRLVRRRRRLECPAPPCACLMLASLPPPVSAVCIPPRSPAADNNPPPAFASLISHVGPSVGALQRHNLGDEGGRFARRRTGARRGYRVGPAVGGTGCPTTLPGSKRLDCARRRRRRRRRWVRHSRGQSSCATRTSPGHVRRDNKPR